MYVKVRTPAPQQLKTRLVKRYVGNLKGKARTRALALVQHLIKKRFNQKDDEQWKKAKDKRHRRRRRYLRNQNKKRA